MLFCQPLSDSSESLIDLLPLPASIALQIKNDVGQKAREIGQNNTARSWRLKLSGGVRSRRPTGMGLRGEKSRKKKDKTRRLAPLPETALAGAMRRPGEPRRSAPPCSAPEDVLPRGSDAPRRSAAMPAPPGTSWWQGGDGHRAGCLSVGLPTCGRFTGARGGQEDALWPGSAGASCPAR